MTYVVKEVFPTLQGEGRWSGRRAVFLRLAGCNVWNGRAEDRSKGLAGCARWCDTDFYKGEKMTASEVVKAIEQAWGELPAGRTSDDCRMVVVTGGEPTLQMDDVLVGAMHREQWFVAVETNGSNDLRCLDACDHVCVSPKAGMPQQRWRGHELKVVLPGGVPGAPPEHRWTDEQVEAIGERGAWHYRFVQPQDPTDEATIGDSHLHRLVKRTDDEDRYAANLKRCLKFIEHNPGWRLSVQSHKYVGLR